MSLEEQVELFEEHGRYLAAEAICGSSATCQGLADFEVVEEPAIESMEGLPYERTPLTTLWRSESPLWSRGDSSLTFEADFWLFEFDVPESPFDELDEKLPNKEKIKRLVTHIRHESTIQFAQKLATRLEFLHEAVMEDSDEAPVSSESLSNFISFLQRTSNLKYPDVVLTPSNEISAQWRTAPNRHFAVVFLPDGTTRYVIFTPNLIDPDKIDRLSGTTSVDTLMETVQPHGVFSWASR